MSILSKPYTFSPNTTISSSEMNANFDTLYNDYNGGISAANLADNAVTTAKIADLNVTTAKLADGSVTAAKLNSNAFRDDSGDWKISTRIDGRKEYYRESNLTTPSLASGTSSNVTLFAAPADVNPYTALWKSLTIYDVAGNTPPQALTYRLQPQNANGGDIIVRFTNPYNSTTGGATFRAAVLLVV